MKTRVPRLLAMLGCLAALNNQPAILAQSTAFTYQGRVMDNGTNFSGAGQFKFALVTSTNFNHQATATATRSGQFITIINVTYGGSGYTSAPAVTISGGGGSGATAHSTLTGDAVTGISVDNPGSGYTSTPGVIVAPPPPNISYATFWSNDGTSVAGSEPSGAVNVAVSNGLFTVVLGDTTQPGMAAIDASIFAQPNLQLRIWFNDGVHGSAALSPVQNLTPAPYAISAGSANSASNLLGTLPVAQLSGAIPAAQLSGTLALAQLPGAVVTNNAGGVNLSGTFSGAGAMLWQVVSGTSQQAQPNAGYLLANNSLVTVTLPASPGAGDMVRVSGGGAGGWKITQNAGQFVSSANLAGNIGVVWTARGTSQSWRSIASSADGAKLAAGIYGGYIWTSTDSGATWTQQTNGDIGGIWFSIASSSDGTKLVAGAGNGSIYVSTNSGTTWTGHFTGQVAGIFVASSSDGTKLVAAIYGGQVYTSTDSGATWVLQAASPSPSPDWASLTSSADGTKLAGVAYGSSIYTSTDSGAHWAAQNPGGGSQNWSSIASSADGTKLVAAVSGGQIYTSTDSGTNWTARDNSRAWSSVASSGDGNRLVATVIGGQIYTSSDSGVTWTAHESSRAWNCVASSADGTKLAAGVNTSQIYTSVPGSVSTTTSGAAGYLIGSPNSAIELIYLGGNQFLPVSHEGIIQAF